MRHAFGLGLAILCSSAFGAPHPVVTGEWVTWHSRNFAGQIDLARALLVSDHEAITRPQGLHPEDLSSALCQLRVWRTLRDEPAQTHPDNRLVCQVFGSEIEPYDIQVNLGNELIERWGNTFYPRGIMFKGDLAEAIFAGLKEVHSRFETALGLKDVSAPAGGGGYGYIAYSLSESDDGVRKNFECSQEFLFSGPRRPDEESYTRCVFVYQFR